MILCVRFYGNSLYDFSPCAEVADVRLKRGVLTLSHCKSGSVAFGSSVGYAPVSFLYTAPIEF